MAYKRRRIRNYNSPEPEQSSELPGKQVKCTAQATTTGYVTAHICPGCMLEKSTLLTPHFTARTFEAPVFHPETNQFQVSGSGVDHSTPAEYLLTLTPNINTVDLTLYFPNRRVNYRVDQPIIVRPCI
jgi:hypothetical protein